MKTNGVKMTPLVRHSKKTDAWNIEASTAAQRAVKVMRAWFPGSAQTLVDILRAPPA